MKRRKFEERKLKMSHAVMIHGKWENVNMTSPVPTAYKMDRPAYSTPPPVENTPANNECHLVELRGAKVASFQIGTEQYICLPQAFDLFLKHLVGGLHTVYTKLKRLSIQPVVCNVEQVRILRGRGAIQPGVNRCKLITKKDFEILYQDCTTASRPGRPPKRYPMLPPSELTSHHSNMASRPGNPLLHQADLFQQHKRMRLENDLHKDRRTSPCKEEIKELQGGNHSNELPSNQAAQIAYFQALRQYQQAANIHNSLEVPAAASAVQQQINPFMMMSHQLLNPQQQMAMFNHINQIAQSQLANGTFAAAAQLAANGQHNHLPSQSILRHHEAAKRNSSPGNDKESDDEAPTSPSREFSTNPVNNGHETSVDYDVADRRSRTSSYESSNDATNQQPHIMTSLRKSSFGPETTHEAPTNVTNSNDDTKSNLDNLIELQSQNCKEQPSTEKLLNNIQELLKVAASSASNQEKKNLKIITELKMMIEKERLLREQCERKLIESEKSREEVNRQWNKQKQENRLLTTKVLSITQLLNFAEMKINAKAASKDPKFVSEATTEAMTSSPRASPQSIPASSPEATELTGTSPTMTSSSGNKLTTSSDDVIYTRDETPLVSTMMASPSNASGNISAMLAAQLVASRAQNTEMTSSSPPTATSCPDNGSSPKLNFSTNNNSHEVATTTNAPSNSDESSIAFQNRPMTNPSYW